MGKWKKFLTRLRHGSSGLNHNNCEVNNVGTCVVKKQDNTSTIKCKINTKKLNKKNDTSNLNCNDKPGPSSMIKTTINDSINHDKHMKKKCEIKKCKGKKDNGSTSDIEKLKILIIKVKQLKKDIEDYEIIHKNNNKNFKNKNKKFAIVQTCEKIIDNNHDALLSVDYCKKQLLKVEEFFKLDNKCDVKSDKCCNILTQHYHTQVDGLPSIIKYSSNKKSQLNIKPSTSKNYTNDNIIDDYIRDEKSLATLNNDDTLIDGYFFKNNIINNKSSQTETFQSLNTPRLKSKTIKSEVNHNTKN